jgi:hypothetical protein
MWKPSNGDIPRYAKDPRTAGPVAVSTRRKQDEAAKDENKDRDRRSEL